MLVTKLKGMVLVFALTVSLIIMKQQAMASAYVHLSKFPLSLAICSFDFSWVISSYLLP